MNSVRNIFFGMLNRIVNILLPFCVRTVIIYVLGAQYIGLSSLFTSILQILNVTELGFSSAVIYHLYKPVANGAEDEIHALLALYKKIYFYVGMVILCTGTILLPFLRLLIKGDVPSDLNLYILYMAYVCDTALSYLLYAYKSALLYASQRYDICINIQTVGMLLQYIVQIIFLLLFKNYYIYIMIIIIGTVGRNLAIKKVVDKRYPQYKILKKIGLDEVTKRDIKYRVTGLFIQKVSKMTRNSFDTVALSMFVGLVAVAQYSNYYYIMYAICGVMGVISESIKASVANSIISDTEANVKELFFSIQFLYTCIAGIAVSFLFCLYQGFMFIWVGTDMMLNMNEVLLFCIYFYSMMMIEIRSMYDDAAGIWWEGRWCAVAESGTNIVLNFTLGRIFGINGVLVASVISIIIWNFFVKSKLIYKKIFPSFSVFELYICQLRWAGIAVIASAVPYMICRIILNEYCFINLILSFIIVAVVNIFLYGTTLIVSKHKNGAIRIIKNISAIKGV